MKNITEVTDPIFCPFRSNGNCDILSHGNWVFKCDMFEDFADECPLSKLKNICSMCGSNKLSGWWEIKK